MTKSYGTNKFKIGTSIAAIAMVVGVAVAPTSNIASAMQSSGNNSTSAQSHETKMGESQKATELRVVMNNLLREHVSSSLNVTRSIAGEASTSQINGAKEAQMLNADALAASIGSVYGGAAQAQFADLFKEHIKESNKYAEAIAIDDHAAANEANMELREYLTDISMFLSSAIPGLQQQDAYGLLNEHEELMNKSVDAFNAGDYVQSYQLEREALKQISRTADALSSGIVATQPDKF